MACHELHRESLFSRWSYSKTDDILTKGKMMTAFFELMAQSLWTLFVKTTDEALKMMGADD